MHHVVLTVFVALTQLAACTGAGRRSRASPGRSPQSVSGPPGATWSLSSRSDRMLYYGADDTAQAIEWFRKAAAQQYPPAEFQMGQLYDFGFGVAQSDGEALSWYRRAAEHGQRAARTSGRRLLSERAAA